MSLSLPLSIFCQFLSLYRLLNAAILKANVACTRIQSLVRRYLSRVVFLKKYKRLFRERLTRQKIKENKGAIDIQRVLRSKLAQKLIAAKKADRREEQKVAKRFEDLENKLESMHSDWLQDLLVIRAQVILLVNEWSIVST